MEGASFESIVKYVQRRTRLTEARAVQLVKAALRAGLALGTIKKTSRNGYVLVSNGPSAIVHKIKEPRLTDDSDSQDSSEESV